MCFDKLDNESSSEYLIGLFFTRCKHFSYSFDPEAACSSYVTHWKYTAFLSVLSIILSLYKNKGP